MKLDADEKETLEAVERGEWRPLKSAKRERNRYSRYARATFRNDRRLNLGSQARILRRFKSAHSKRDCRTRSLSQACFTSTHRDDFEKVSSRSQRELTASLGGADHNSLKSLAKLSAPQGINLQHWTSP